jgi:hypothetical protein
VEKELSMIIEKLGHFPTCQELREMRRGDISNAISRYYGGMHEIRKRLGFESNRKPPGYWKSWQHLVEELQPEIEKLKHFPSTSELDRMSKWGIINAMRSYHGGYPAVREKLGYGPPEKSRTNEEDRQKFRELYENGCSIQEIAEKTGRNPITVNNHLKKLGVVRSRSEALKIAYKRGKRRMKSIPEVAKELSIEKAYILGVLGPGDGHIREKGIQLSVTDKDFAWKFKACLEAVYRLSCSVRIVYKEGNRKPQVMVYLLSKAVASDILRYGNSLMDFRHGGEKVPTAIKTAGLEIQASYLQAITDSQGSVRFHEVRIHKKNLKVLEEIGHLLKNFGIRCRIEKSKNRAPCITIRHRKFLQRFYDTIGFSIKRKQEKLAEVLNSYKVKSTEEINETVPQMIQLRERGLSISKIAGLLGVSWPTVAHRLRKGFSPDNRKTICEL